MDHTYIHKYYKDIQIPFCAMSLNNNRTLATGRTAGVGTNWSVLSPCSQPTDLTSPLPLAGVFIHSFTVLPTGTAWLGSSKFHY